MDFKELMAQRRSVRQFDPAVTIDRATLTALIDTANRAPSSNNSQPWRFHVITDQPLRAQLLPIAYGQQQVLSAAALVLVCADRDAYGVDNLRRIHQAQYENGRYDAATRDFLIERGAAFYREALNERGIAHTQGLDIGLWAMAFMLAARAAGWDTVPMSGFKHGELRQWLNLPNNYDELLLIAIGKAAQSGHPTLRRPAAELISWNNSGN